MLKLKFTGIINPLHCICSWSSVHALFDVVYICISDSAICSKAVCFAKHAERRGTLKTLMMVLREHQKLYVMWFCGIYICKKAVGNTLIKFNHLVNRSHIEMIKLSMHFLLRMPSPYQLFYLMLMMTSFLNQFLSHFYCT
jgi:hypothetical protein